MTLPVIAEGHWSFFWGSCFPLDSLLSTFLQKMWVNESSYQGIHCEDGEEGFQDLVFNIRKQKLMHSLNYFTEKKICQLTEFEIFHPVPPSRWEVLHFSHLQHPLEYLQFLDLEYLLMLSWCNFQNRHTFLEFLLDPLHNRTVPEG